MKLSIDLNADLGEGAPGERERRLVYIKTVSQLGEKRDEPSRSALNGGLVSTLGRRVVRSAG